MFPVRVEEPSMMRLPFAEILPVVSRVEPVPEGRYPPPICISSTFAAAEVALNSVAFGRFTIRLLIAVVPVPPPMETVVASPPKLRVETPVGRKLNVVSSDVIVPPFTARLAFSVVSLVTANVPPIPVLPKESTSK